MIKNSKLSACIKLAHKVTVYVPATIDVDKAVDNTEQVRQTATLLASLFGGSTSSEARGYWVSNTGNLIGENTTLVFAYASENDLKNGIDDVVMFCENMRDSMKQEAIALEVDGEMYFI